ncbi:MAG TPA: hypothetical protein VL588_11265 [Bdellovibrionota bacterium]|jgi:hypothetical protein|nr:hypothetical protein [Bdellovibrionota bacterium]
MSDPTAKPLLRTGSKVLIGTGSAVGIGTLLTFFISASNWVDTRAEAKVKPVQEQVDRMEHHWEESQKQYHEDMQALAHRIDILILRREEFGPRGR